MLIYNNTDNTTGTVRSSKGNQLKFCIDDKWYKADFLGYEGAAEHLASTILSQSNITAFVNYNLQEINYNDRIFNGCVSTNFLKQGESLITLGRLYKNQTNQELSENLKRLSLKEKILRTVDFVEKTTGLSYFGQYLTSLLEFDALILNEDRHLHNIALIRTDSGYKYCPIFDNGAGFLSDTQNEYLLWGNIFGHIANVKAKPFSTSFDNQMTACEALYGKQLQINKNIDITEAINRINSAYKENITARISSIFNYQKSLYPELFAEHLHLHLCTWEQPPFPSHTEHDII